MRNVQPPSPPQTTAPPQSATEKHSRNTIVNTALTLLKQLGLPGLTMRKLAQELNVTPPAIYWHFADKQSLLAELSSHILSHAYAHSAQSPTADRAPEDNENKAIPSNLFSVSTQTLSWECTLRNTAQDLRQTLMSYRDGAELVSSSLALGLIQLPIKERITPSLIAAGMSLPHIDTVSVTLGHFILGHTFHEQQRQAAQEMGVISKESGTSGTAFDEGIDLIVAGAAVVISMDHG